MITPQQWKSEATHTLKVLYLDDSINNLWNSMHNSLVESISVDERLHLRDSLSFKRFKTPCKGISCEHIPCFELEVYQQYNKSRNVNDYRCPICDKTCNSSKLYVDSVLFNLLTLFPNDDVVALSPDGGFIVPKNNVTNSSLISLDDECSECTTTDSKCSVPLSTHCSHLLQLSKFQQTASRFETVRWSELCQVALEDVVQFLNSPQSDEVLLTGVQGVPKKCGKLLIASRPFVCATLQGLNHALQMADGIGRQKADKIIEHCTALLEKRLTAIRVLPRHGFCDLTKPTSTSSMSSIGSNARSAGPKSTSRAVIHLDESPPPKYNKMSGSTSSTVPFNISNNTSSSGSANTICLVDLTEEDESALPPVGARTNSSICPTVAPSESRTRSDDTPATTNSRKRSRTSDCAVSDSAACDSYYRSSGRGSGYVVRPRPAAPVSSTTATYRSAANSGGRGNGRDGSSLTSLMVDYFLSDL